SLRITLIEGKVRVQRTGASLAEFQLREGSGEQSDHSSVGSSVVELAPGKQLIASLQSRSPRNRAEKMGGTSPGPDQKATGDPARVSDNGENEGDNFVRDIDT